MIQYFKHRLFVGMVIMSCFFMTSCATIIGGSNYYAHVMVKNHPNATISYKNIVVGTGSAYIKVPRREANRFYLEIKEEGCNVQFDSFKSRSFRTVAFIGTIVGWTGLTPEGFPLPWGVAVDLGTGALWKPDEWEEGITKVDSKNYNYTIKYRGCKEK